MGTYRDGEDLGLGSVPGVPGSSDNLYVARLDRDDGALRWTRAFPATQTVLVSLALTTKNRPVALGAFDGTLRVDDEEWHSTGPLGSLFLLGFER